MVHIFFLFLSIINTSLYGNNNSEISRNTSHETPLILRACRKKEIVEHYCEQLFIKDNKNAIIPLIRMINKSSSQLQVILYVTIVDWIMDTQPANGNIFIGQLSRRTLSHYYSPYNTTVKDYILKKALRLHANSIIQKLLPYFSPQELIEKNTIHKNYLDYAIDANNNEAIHMLSERLIQKNSNIKNYFIVALVTSALILIPLAPYILAGFYVETFMKALSNGNFSLMSFR